MWVLAQWVSIGQTLPAPCLKGPMLGSTVLCCYSEILNIFFLSRGHTFSFCIGLPKYVTCYYKLLSFTCFMFFLHGIYQLLKLCFTCFLVFHRLLQTEEKLLNRKHLVCLESLCRPRAQFITGFQKYFWVNRWTTAIASKTRQRSGNTSCTKALVFLKGRCLKNQCLSMVISHTHPFLSLIYSEYLEPQWY